MKRVNYELLLKLTADVPSGLDRKKKKGPIDANVRQKVVKRDDSSCQMCGLKDKYGNPGWDIPGKLAIHHIIPNGPGVLDNLVTLCKYCHCAVHMILFAEGKWRYVPVK